MSAHAVDGDLIALAQAGHFDVIVHGCNCFCTMGAGIAKQIRQHFPEAWAADQATRAGDASKLGLYTAARVVRDTSQFVVVNAYTQFNWRGNGLKADYQAIEQVFAGIARDFAGLRIGYPRIGAGLAGGDWSRIEAIIGKALAGEQHTLVEFNPTIRSMDSRVEAVEDDRESSPRP